MMKTQAALTEAISLTDEILAVLDDQDFALIEALDSQRQPLIKLAFAQSVEDIDNIKAHHLQNLNQQVIEKLIGLKQSVLEQQQQIRKSSHASKAYSDQQASRPLRKSVG